MQSVPRTLQIVAVAVVLLIAPGSAISHQQALDWNQWRGPARDGVGDPSTLPAELPTELTRRWQVPVGAGHASPAVVGDVVYLHSREGEEEVARALSLADGSEIWRQSYAAPYTMNPAARSHGPGPKSTPVVVDGRMFTFGITEILSAFDATSGELLWRREFSDQYPEPAPIFGSAMSPIVVDDVLIVHIGWSQAGALTAFDVATGETRWTNDEFTPGYASPIVVEIDDTPILVTQSDKHIIVVKLDDGGTAWSMPFETDYRQNSVTPLAFGDKVVLSGLDEDLFVMRLQSVRGVAMATGSTPQRGRPSHSEVIELQAWTATEVWRNDRLPLYMSSPVRVGNRMFGMSHKRAGQFLCIDLDTGEPIWTSRGREGENAALVALGDRVAFLTDDARLVIVDSASDSYEPLVEYEVATTPTWAHPAFTSQGVLIKDLKMLALWSF